MKQRLHNQEKRVRKFCLESFIRTGVLIYELIESYDGRDFDI